MKIDFESISSLSLSGFTSVLVVLDQEKKQNQLSIICLDNRSYMKHYSYFRNAINYMLLYIIMAFMEASIRLYAYSRPNRDLCVTLH